LFEETELARIRDVVAEVIDEGRLGVARFLRCHAVTADATVLDSSLASLTSLGEAWFGSRPSQTHRLGEGSGLYLTDMLTWDGGQGAIVTVSVGSYPEARLDLLLVGSKGSLYHQD
jgi:hypothetical protein